MTVLFVVVLPGVEAAFFRSRSRAGVPGLVVLLVIAAAGIKADVEQQLPVPGAMEPSEGVAGAVLHLVR